MRSQRDSNSNRLKGVKDVEVMPQKLSHWPHKGQFGKYGGYHNYENLSSLLTELEETFQEFKDDDNLQRELRTVLTDYGGRQTALYHARRLSQQLGGARIYLKREDLSHCGLIDMSNALSQALIARRLRKKKLISAVLSSKQAMALAMAARLYGMEAKIYIGQKVFDQLGADQHELLRVKEMGSQYAPVKEDGGGIVAAVTAALNNWSSESQKSHLAMMLPVGPHPLPWVVRECQRVIGDEIKGQILRKERRLPDQLVVSYESGAEILGVFAPFVDDEYVKCVCVESMRGFSTSHNPLVNGKEGIYCGTKSLYYSGQPDSTSESHYYEMPCPLAPPELAFYHDNGRLEYFQVTDQQARDAARQVLRAEGIILSRDGAHVIHALIDRAKQQSSDGLIIGIISGIADDGWMQVTKSPLLSEKYQDHDAMNPHHSHPAEHSHQEFDQSSAESQDVSPLQNQQNDPNLPI